jgi:hypothetical protein
MERATHRARAEEGRKGRGREKERCKGKDDAKVRRGESAASGHWTSNGLDD